MEPISQHNLLADIAPVAAGLHYRSELITLRGRSQPVARVHSLPFAFEFHGFKGRRRVVSYGWCYGFGRAHLEPAGRDVAVFGDLPTSARDPVAAQDSPREFPCRNVSRQGGDQHHLDDHQH